MVESSGLLNRRTGLNLYRGFESLPLRQPLGIDQLQPGSLFVLAGQQVNVGIQCETCASVSEPGTRLLDVHAVFHPVRRVAMPEGVEVGAAQLPALE